MASRDLPATAPHPPPRLLLGAGPSNVHPRVYQALLAPVVGYLDPYLLHLLAELQERLRRVFRTRNGLTLAVSGTGTAGMECAVANLIEPGDVFVVGVNGYFGDRLAQIAERHGAEVVRVEGEWGRPLDPEAVERALKAHPRVKALGVVHAETSTGVLQDLRPLAELARRHDALLVVDAVTSLAGSPLEVDGLGIDFAFSATQKCLACPPGLAPITASERALQAIQSRRQRSRSWYLDLSLLRNYWGELHHYHHTAPVTLLYALHEGLHLVLEEGLESRWERHRRAGRALWAGLTAMGLGLLVDRPEDRAPQLTTVRVPEGVDEREVRRALLEEFGIEISGGLGALAGRVWRVGLMGENARLPVVLTFLSALEQVLRRLGVPVPPGEGVAEAQRAWAAA